MKKITCHSFARFDIICYMKKSSAKNKKFTFDNLVASAKKELDWKDHEMRIIKLERNLQTK